MAYWLGERPEGAECPNNKAASLAAGKAACSVFDVSALRLTITHIDSDGTKLFFEAPPVMPWTKGPEARPLVKKEKKPSKAKANARTVQCGTRSLLGAHAKMDSG